MKDHEKPGMGPLAGVRVLDVGTLIAGPFTATLLGELGANVTKVEHPSGDSARGFGAQKDGKGIYWKSLSRNKRCITLDLSKDEGQHLFLRLVEQVDVVVENFRPGTLERWNVGWEQIEQTNPRAILLRTSGFGASGPYLTLPGYGTLGEAMSGFAHSTGHPDGPPTFPQMPVADLTAAAHGAIAVLAALYHRDVRQGRGQWLDNNIYEPIMRGLELVLGEYDQLGIVRHRYGNRLPDAAPRGAYETSEAGKWVALSGSSDATARRILVAIGREDLAAEPELQTNAGRVRNADRIDDALQDWIGRHTQDEVLRRFRAVHAPIAPVYDAADIFEDAHFRARESLVEVDDKDFDHVTMVQSMPRFSRTPMTICFPGPDVGAHNTEIYGGWLGLDGSELARLEELGVI